MFSRVENNTGTCFLIRSSALTNPSPTWTRTVDVEPTESGDEVNRDDAGAAFSGAVGAADHHETGTGGIAVSEVPVQTGNDPALQLLAEVWGELPNAVKNRILRLADENARPFDRATASDAR